MKDLRDRGAFEGVSNYEGIAKSAIRKLGQNHQHRAASANLKADLVEEGGASD